MKKITIVFRALVDDSVTDDALKDITQGMGASDWFECRSLVERIDVMSIQTNIENPEPKEEETDADWDKWYKAAIKNLDEENDFLKFSGL